MAVISAKLSIGEIECMVGVGCRRNARLEKRRASIISRKTPPVFSEREAPTVHDFMLSPRERIASAIASATLVRDVAALGALVLFGTMLVLVLSSADLLV